MKIALFILSFSCAALLYLAFTQGARIAQFERIGTECRKLQDEKELLSSVHAITGVTCIYSLSGYGMAKRTRPATTTKGL